MGNQSSAARRTWVVEEFVDPESELPVGVYDRDEARALLADLESVLFTVGGMVAITAEREQVDELGGEPLAATRRLIIQWQAYSPMKKATPEPVPEPAPVVEREAPEPVMEGAAS